MSGIKIRGTGRFAPAKIVTNDDLAKIVDTSDEWITTRTGIQTRHHCTTETHTDMCVGAARQALENAGISPEDIGACVVATFTSDYLSPSAACMVQRGLGLPHDTVCFDLNAACSGFLFALHTMECLLAQAPRKYGLVIGAEMLSAGSSTGRTGAPASSSETAPALWWWSGGRTIPPSTPFWAATATRTCWASPARRSRRRPASSCTASPRLQVRR